MRFKSFSLGLSATLLASTTLAAPPAWEVTDADSRVILFPTIHALPEGLNWKTETLIAEIETAEEVWLEIADSASPDVQAEIQALVAEKGVSPDTPLSDRLSETQLATLQARLDMLGVPLQAIDPMRPWMAATALTMAALAQSGITGASGVETGLQTVFADRPVRNLETAAFQVEMLAGLAGDDQVEFLMNALDEMDDMSATLQRVAESWAEGDVDLMQSELLDRMEQDYPEIFAIIFTNRNANWADIIETELQGSGSDFIAVGAGHLIGDTSVQALLRERGYSVKRISLAD